MLSLKSPTINLSPRPKRGEGWVRGIKISFSIPYFLISLKTKEIFEEENCLTPPLTQTLSPHGARA